MEYNFCIDTIRWQMSKSTKDSTDFALALTISELLKCCIFYFQKVGHGHGVKFSR